MTHVIWIAACLVGWGILAGFWRIDKRQAEAFMDGQSKMIDQQSAEMVRLRRATGDLRRSLYELEDWGQPLIFGDRPRDLLCVTVQLISETRVCLTVIRAIPVRRFRIDVPHIAWSTGPLTRWNEAELLLSIGNARTKATIGVEHLKIIADAVRRYNEAYHQLAAHDERKEVTAKARDSVAE